MKKYPPSPKKATAQTVASNNIIAYGIFRFHEGMSICRFHELSHTYAAEKYKELVNGGWAPWTPTLPCPGSGHERPDVTDIYLTSVRGGGGNGA